MFNDRKDGICRRTTRQAIERFQHAFMAHPNAGSEIRRKHVERLRAFTHRRWQLDEIYARINGVQHYLWRAVDGELLEPSSPKIRGKAAALTFVKKGLKGHGSLKAITTHGPRS